MIDFTFKDFSKVFYLKATTQKSYYNKAVAIDNDDVIILKSYDTIVCYLDKDKKIHKMWGGYSKTTMNHIKDFCKLYNVDFIANKKNWLALPLESGKENKLYKIRFTNGFVWWDCGAIFDDYDEACNYADSVCDKNSMLSYEIDSE